MRKKVLSLSILGIVIVALLYTIYTNLFQSNESKLINEEDIHSLIEEEEIEEQQTEVADVQLQYIDEPELVEQEHDNEEQKTEVQTVHRKASDFQLKTLTGDTIRLSSLKGKKVFINFWATWCPPCVEEMPVIQQYYEQYAKANNIEIISVNATDLEFDIETISQFAADYGITFPILLDEKGEVSISYEVLTIPTSLIINEDGMIVEQIIGPVTEEMLKEKLG